MIQPPQDPAGQATSAASAASAGIAGPPAGPAAGLPPATAPGAGSAVGGPGWYRPPPPDHTGPRTPVRYGPPSHVAHLPRTDRDRPPIGDDDPLISPDYAGWWRRGFALFKATWNLLLAVHLVAGAVSALLAVAGAVMAGRYLGRGVTEMVLLIVAPHALFDGIALMVGVYLVVGAAAGRRPGVATALRAAAGRLGPLIGWTVVTWAVIGLGLVFGVLPGLYAWLVFLILPPAVAFGRGGGAACLSLVHGNPGTALARLSTVGSVLAIGVWVRHLVQFAIVVLILLSEIGPLGEDFGVVAVFVVALSVVVNAALAAFAGPLVVCAYADLRARRDGPLTTADLAAELHA